jgi:hypothetical protein
MNNFTVAVQN